MSNNLLESALRSCFITVLLVLGGGAQAVIVNPDPIQLPSLVASGSPNFVFGELGSSYDTRVYQGSLFGNSTLIARDIGSFAINDPDGSVKTGIGSFTLRADFSNGQLDGGFVTIRGSVPDKGVYFPQTLMTADVIAFAYDDHLIGFNTDNIVCNISFSVPCTNAESVYLALDPDGRSYTGPSQTLFFGNSVSITTVPLPASFWLFGSGVLGILGVFRKINSGKVYSYQAAT